jgi:hypothetical protein
MYLSVLAGNTGAPCVAQEVFCTRLATRGAIELSATNGFTSLLRQLVSYSSPKTTRAVISG